MPHVYHAGQLHQSEGHYDYLHVGTALRDRLHSGSYLQEPREQHLTDHAAVTLTLNLPVDTLTIRDTPPVAEPATLF